MRKSFASFLPCADDADREGREELQSGGITTLAVCPWAFRSIRSPQKEWKDVGRVCILRVLQAAGIIRHDPEMDSMESVSGDKRDRTNGRLSSSCSRTSSRKCKSFGVDMNVSVESIMLISATNALRVLAKYSMDHISCVLPGVLIEDSHYFCMFAKTESAINGSTEMKRRCYVFDGGPEVAEVLRMINLAFEVREQLQASAPSARPVPAPRTYSRDKDAHAAVCPNAVRQLHADQSTSGRARRTERTVASTSTTTTCRPAGGPPTPTATPPPAPPPPPPRPMALVEPNGHVRHHSDSRSRVRVELTPPDVNRGLQPPPLPPRIRSHRRSAAAGIESPESAERLLAARDDPRRGRNAPPSGTS
ncbi:hypothetical protein M3Y99_00362900 [Aphelenchoides fujianensis]|nr:hypothetical protein M3Y99_00362900 [Aphelenchoides fujianensis]